MQVLGKCVGRKRKVTNYKYKNAPNDTSAFLWLQSLIGNISVMAEISQRGVSPPFSIHMDQRILNLPKTFTKFMVQSRPIQIKEVGGRGHKNYQLMQSTDNTHSIH
mmetsp:Transcript_11637/g.20229  ORF Transcript_11637/g.20229 Transcript_11637/m.20229 type:complete len:106 (-) Transcript_11637:143-460(-)